MKIKDILTNINYSRFIGDENAIVTKIVNLEDTANEHYIRWVNLKNINEISKFSSGTIICPIEIDVSKLNPTINYILCENPRNSFRELLILFQDTEPSNLINIHNNSWVDKNIKIPEDIRLGVNVIIEKDVEIGKNTAIGHNTVIKKGTIIKDNVTIGCNCTIGGEGFGYEKTKDKLYNFIPHIGNVIISEWVEIGNNTCIDRAVIGSTYIGENVKIDNLVHIAHGVEIQKNSLIIANTMIAGSVKIGEDCWISPSSSILNKVTIKDNAVVGLGAVVLKNVDSNTVVVGNPSKVLKTND